VAAPAETYEEPTRWEPQPGPQTQFAECSADIAVYGGSAGGGKSFALIYEAAKWIHLGTYRAILFRRTGPELTGGGGLWDESKPLYRALGGRFREGAHLDVTFDSGARVEFRHLQRERDVTSHSGRQYAYVGFDELQTFTERQFWFLLSRLRSSCGVRPYMRGTCNPDPDSFLRTLLDWWIGSDGYPIEERSGVIRWLVRQDDSIYWYDSKAEALRAHPHAAPLSLTFIAARLADNRFVDPTYRAFLRGLPRVDRQRLLGDEARGGNWDVREGAGLVFRREDFVVADAPPARILRTVRAWDKGARPPTADYPDPDWTRGVRVSLCEGGYLWIDHLVSLRDGPARVFRAIRQTAAGGDLIPLDGGEVGAVGATDSSARAWPGDGPACTVVLWRDPGGAGIVDTETTQDVLAGFPTEVIHSASSPVEGPKRKGRAKLDFAKVWSREVDHRRVYVKRAPWTGEVLAEADAFPDGAHDDIIDAVSAAAQVLIGPGFAFLEGLSEAVKRWQ